MLRRNFSYLNPKQFIFMRKKPMLHGDIMIDDKPSNFGPYMGRKLMFTAYHNKQLSDKLLNEQGIERVDSWYDIANILLK